MTSGDVMDASAVLLNDTAKQIFTYTAQLPYVNMALRELQESLEECNVPLNNATNTSIVIPAGTTTLGFATSPALPANLIEIQELSERLNGSNNDYILMARVEFLPPYVQQVSDLIYFTWQNQTINFIGALSDRQLKLDYIAAVLSPVTNVLGTDVINMLNAQSFLQYRVAALCAQFIGENEDRANMLNQFASLALDRVLNINTKGKQAMPARRRPFQSAYRVWGNL